MGFGVKRDTVFRAFRAKKVSYASGADDYVETADGNGNLSTEYIPPELARREPARLAAIYDIPLNWFYFPEMIPDDDGEGKSKKVRDIKKAQRRFPRR